MERRILVTGGCGFKLSETFESGLLKTVEWYIDNRWWWKGLGLARPNVDRVAQKGYR